jgi:hypothetical protein
MNSTEDQIKHSTATDGKPPVSGSIIFLSYTIYIVLYEALVIGGCGYVTFGLGHSGWWWLLAILFSSGAYSPSKWNRLLTGKEDAPEK